MILKFRRRKNPYLFWCMMIAALLCVAQIYGNQLLILTVLMLFLGLIAVSSYHGAASLILLFFLPWSPLLKTEPGTMSLYTIALILVCAIHFLRKKFSVNIICAVLGLLLFLVTLISKVAEGYAISNSYILFIFLLVLFPLVMGELQKQVDFRQMTVYFAIGIIAAALSAKYLVVYPKIARYIDVYSWNVVTRLSGYYGDANFYSAHISAALSGVLLLFIQDKGRQRLLQAVMAVLLLYCGLLSASKSFILTLVVMLVIWFGSFFFTKGQAKQKIVGLFVALAVVAIIAVTDIFREQWEVIVFRFGQSSTLSGLTTGRTYTWRMHLQELTSGVKQFLLGKGFTNILINGKASHNTAIQLVYQFGVIGCILLIFWEIYSIRGVLRHYGKRKWDIGMIVMLIGIFMPWMGIDLVFFDEFFLMPMYFVAGICYTWGQTDTVDLDSVGKDTE